MNKPIAEKSAEFRKARSLTQEKLGEMLGVSSQAVSKWEKGDSLPDIMLLPQLCEVFGVTADALLEVPTSIKKDNVMAGLIEYANEVGSVKSSFEAVKACSFASDTSMEKGSALQAYNGIRICATEGLAFIIDGKSEIQKVLNTDFDNIKKMCVLLSDENVIKVLRALDFTKGITESEIKENCNLPDDVVDSELFRLMKFGFCECTLDGLYTFGGMSYSIFAILGGMYISSLEGHVQINSVCRNYPPVNDISG